MGKIDLLNRPVKSRSIYSFYSSNGNVIVKWIPSSDELKRFKKKNGDVFALDGIEVKRIPPGPEAMYRYVQNYCISAKMRKKIEKEGFKLTEVLKRKVYDLQGRKCVICGSEEGFHIDHKIPLFRGGKTVINNLQVLCSKCNLQKGAFTMEEFLEWREGHGTSE